MSHDGHPTEFLAELALDALPAAQAEPVRAHLAACADCSAEYERMARAAHFLPLAAEAVEPRETTRTRVLERIREEPRAPADQPLPFRAPRWALAAAAAVVLAVTGAVAFIAGRTSDGDGSPGDAEYQALARAVATGAADISRAESGGASVSLVREGGARQGFAWVEGLPALPEGQAYQAWFSRDGQTMEPSDVFTAGEGGVWLSSAAPMGDYTLLAFTIEDAAGAAQPTGSPFLVVPLSAQ